MRRGRIVDMGVAVVVPVRMPVVVGMAVRVAMSRVVMMGVGRDGNHAKTLYYNITPVHGRAGLADHHRNSEVATIPHSKEAAARATASVVVSFQASAAGRRD